MTKTTVRCAVVAILSLALTSMVAVPAGATNPGQLRKLTGAVVGSASPSSPTTPARSSSSGSSTACVRTFTGTVVHQGRHRR